MCWLSFDKRLHRQGGRQSWRRVVLGAIRTNHIAASMFKRLRTPPQKEFRGHLLCKNSGGTFHATPTQGNLSCKKQNQKARIKSEHTHAIIIHRQTKALIEYMRTMISCWLQHTQITTPSQNKKPKIQIGLSTSISDTHRCPRVKFLQGLSVTNPIFFMTFPNCHRYSPSIDCVQIRSINWMYSAKSAHGTPMSRRFSDKRGGRALLITLCEAPYWGSAAVLSPMLALRGSPDPATCEACHRDRRHQPRLVTGPPGGPTGPRWDGGPAGGLIELEVSLLGGSGLCHN